MSPFVDKNRLWAGQGVHAAFCNMPSLLFTGLPAMMQNLPILKRDYVFDHCRSHPITTYPVSEEGAPMFGFTHLFDNALLGFILLSVLTIFFVSVLFSIATCFRPTLAPSSHNFTYVATAIAGLVLSVASGVLGKPATIELSKPPSIQSSTAGASISSVQANVSNNQIGNFQQLYAWAYVLAGLLCLTIFVMPTPGNHDLVKSVALTTLGFLVTIVGTLTAQAPAAAIQQATQSVVKDVVSRSNALF